jgi:site-specific DNA-methyltransferase (adenine-specific)
MVDKGHKSLDEILCDPLLASEFDAIAASFAPNFDALQYRWAALKLRKTAQAARTRARLLDNGRTHHLSENFGEPLQAFHSAWKTVPEKSGIYLVTRRDDKKSLYLGEALNLKGRLRTQFGSSPAKKAWQTHCDTSNLSVQLFTAEVGFTDLIAYQSILVGRYRPLLNSENLAAV